MGDRQGWCPQDSQGEGSNDLVADPSARGCAAARGKWGAGRHKA